MRALRSLILLLSACASLALAAPVRAQAAAPAPALWVVRGGAATVHLFGTIHLLPPGVAWFSGETKAAFDRSGEVVLELVVPTPEAARGTLLQRALAPGAEPMAARLGPATRDAYGAALASLGVPADAFDPFHTWFAAVALTTAAAERAGYAVAQGPEAVLTAAAAAAGKPVVGLETLDEQLAILGSMPKPVQRRFLAVTVEQLPDAPRTLGAMLDAWRAGDPDRLAAVLQEGMRDLPEATELLMERRNVRWARWIAERLKTPGNVFLAVGAGHLAGPRSLQAELAALGLRAERVR